MSIPSIVICVLLLIVALFVIVAVLMQQGKSHNLSGTIAGGAETFFGKSKAQAMNKKLSTFTTIAAIVFVVLVIVLYVMQDTGSSSDFDSFWDMLTGDANEVLVDETTVAVETTASPETTVAPVETTAPVETSAE